MFVGVVAVLAGSALSDFTATAVPEVTDDPTKDVTKLNTLNEFDLTINPPSSGQMLFVQSINQTAVGPAPSGLAIWSILCRAVVAVAQTLSMALIGLIFGRLGIITANVRKVLSSVSMNIMIPSLLFSSMMDCPQGGPEQDQSLCPDLEESLRFAWPLFILPILWVSTGMVCGLLTAVVSRAPRDIWWTMMAACAFSNSTGLPITLLTALSSANLGGRHLNHNKQQREYLLLVSIYQVLYPMIQWTVGRRLLEQKEEDDEELESTLRRDLEELQQTIPELPDRIPKRKKLQSWLQFVREVVSAALVPPVVAVLCSFTISMVNVNGHLVLKDLFVDTTDFDDDQPLEWMFNAILAFGKAAVPLNMLVLGSGLGNIPKFSTIHWSSTLALVFAKLVLHPAIGFGIMVLAVQVGFISNMGGEPQARENLVLVACLLCATPTANNLAVMAEVGGGPKCKAALTSAIFVMYCFAPFLLTAWIVLFVAYSESIPN